jgi:hypothetical protein
LKNFYTPVKVKLLGSPGKAGGLPIVFMKVLLVNGSSRNNGCTNVALNEVVRSLNEEKIETEIVFRLFRLNGGKGVKVV